MSRLFHVYTTLLQAVLIVNDNVQYTAVPTLTVAAALAGHHLCEVSAADGRERAAEFGAPWGTIAPGSAMLLVFSRPSLPCSAG